VPVVHWRKPDPTLLIPYHHAELAPRLSNFVHLQGFNSRIRHIYLPGLIYKSEFFFARTLLVWYRGRRSGLLGLRPL
jgi:hypothetical protein